MVLVRLGPLDPEYASPERRRRIRQRLHILQPSARVLNALTLQGPSTHTARLLEKIIQLTRTGIRVRRFLAGGCVPAHPLKRG